METLEIVIGLVFVFLLLSLLATTVQEIVATLFSLRGRVLLKALMQLLEMEDEVKTVASRGNSTGRGIKRQIKDSEVYKKYMGTWLWQKKLPSYLSAEQAIAVINDVLEKDEQEEMPVAFDENQPFQILPQERSTEANARTFVPSTISNMKQEDLKKQLTVIYNSDRGTPLRPTDTSERGTNVKDIAENIEAEVQKAKAAFNKQYDEIMDRASGWYKKNVQLSLLIIGLAIGLAFDADTFKIYGNLTMYPEDRQQLLEIAEGFVENDQYSNYTSANDSLTNVATSNADQLAEITALRKTAENILLEQLSTVPSPLGLGWEKSLAEQYNEAEKKWLMVLAKLGGWLITALAISLGAPFWFDLLQKVIQIRSAGKRPNDKPGVPGT
jgi:hypothetical protein